MAVDIRNVTSHNVIATTKSGDQNNKLILGAHSDSVIAGPGINDNGSGINALLEVARALSKYKINNAVTFAFWSAEEATELPGSTHFVKTLSAADNAKIRAYLNFDMVRYTPEDYLCPRRDLSADTFSRSLLHPITSTASTTVTARYSASPVPLARLSCKSSSKTTSKPMERTTLQQNSTDALITRLFSTPAFQSEELQLAQRRRRL